MPNGRRVKNNRLSHLIKRAGFAFSDACIGNIEYRNDHKPEKVQISDWLVATTSRKLTMLLSLEQLAAERHSCQVFWYGRLSKVFSLLIVWPQLLYLAKGTSCFI